MAACASAVWLASCTSAPPVNRDPATPLTTVSRVEVDRYLGEWYEIARFENRFEEGCEGVTAAYAFNDTGSIAVTNTCRKASMGDAPDIAKGTARIVDSTSNAKLKVSFDPFGWFEGDYWIIGLAENYEWALVGEPSGRYLWILARTPRIDAGLKAALVEDLGRMGYNTGALHWTLQPEG
ncbi:MAG: lipocalin family protein [Alphaproteobacteria bacterium]|nr:lipocalin family protein [Alphaproteobacteria bacterium]